MANVTFNPFLGTKLKRVATVYPVVSVGAAGAVTLKKRQFTAAGASNVAASSSLVNAPTTGVGYAVGDAMGIRTVARTGAGAWTITLSDPYQYLLGVEIIQISNATGIATVYAIGVVSGTTNVTTNTAIGNGGVITVLLQNGSGASNIGAAVDPASGDTLTLRITLGDATEP